MSLDNNLESKYDDPYQVPIMVANEKNLKGYGTIVTDFEKEKVEIAPWPVSGKRKLHPGTGSLGGTRSGEFICKWEGDACQAINKGVDDTVYITGRLPTGIQIQNRTHLLVREANYHPDGGQVFFPRDKDPFIALLALPGDDVKPEDFVAFYFDGSFGIQMYTHIWHQAVIPINDRSVFLTKQAASYACVDVDTIDEFGKYLSVPLKL
ncbi:Hypothetical predicted protein [Mytilus galloprovincialis]|uniref:Ureidoglycolate hydrolase n=1 Tax=Mytilus galloprovincialis TaxID=29158 RepID=A0A8B6D2Z0_MYTGA|nr:Hypothetical predicted protein [Mytilus galloprovincialis]